MNHLITSSFAVIGFAALAFWLMMLAHAITNNGLTDVEKIMWVLLIILLPVIGVIAYFLVGRPKKPGSPA